MRSGGFSADEEERPAGRTMVVFLPTDVAVLRTPPACAHQKFQRRSQTNDSLGQAFDFRLLLFHRTDEPDHLVVHLDNGC